VSGPGNTFRAFGEEARRQALIADIRNKGPIYTAWLTRASIEGDISAISAEHGLHPALARLLPALGAFGEAEDARSFYEALLNAIPVGAETGELAGQTLLLAWTDPVYGRARMVAPGPVRDACEGVVALVKQSVEQAVDKKAWRSARATLAAVRHDDPAAEKATDLVMSLGWDLDQAPGAAHDVISAWSAAVNLEADASDEDCFTAEESATFETEMNKVNEEAMDALAQGQSVESIGVEDFMAEVEKLWRADPVRHALKQRSVARRQRSNAKVAAWRQSIQRRMLDLAHATLAAATMAIHPAEPVGLHDWQQL
jgi:hypothetical protein